MLNLTLTFGPFPLPEMAPKNKPPPLHVSLARIEMERITIAQCTRTRIALLLPHAQNHNKEEEVAGEINSQHYYGPTIFYFCVLLLLLNLLFLQWVYYKVHNVKR